MGPTDCMDGNVESAHRHIYHEVVKLRQLNIFLDPKVLVSRSPAIATLSLKERLQLAQVMKGAHELKKAEDELQELFEEMWKEFGPLGTNLDGKVDSLELEDGPSKGKGLADDCWLF